jgi:hypothetical protein
VQLGLLCELAFNLGDQRVALPVHLVLGVEQGAALLVALAFEGLDLLLAGELVLQGEGGRRGPRP